MEIYSISTAALSLNNSLGRVISNWIYSKIMRYKLRRRLHAVILMKGCSTLCQKYSSSEILFLDIDVLMSQLCSPKSSEEVNTPPTILENYMAYPILLQHLYAITKAFKKQIVVVSKSYELVAALNIPANNTHFFAFSKEMDDRTLPLFNGNEKEHAESVVKKLRTRDHFQESQIVVVDSMSDLESKLKAKFNIHHTEI